MTEYPGEKNALLRKITIIIEHQDNPVFTMRGSLFDFGNKSLSHDVIFDKIYDHSTGNIHRGGIGTVTGLTLQELPLPMRAGAPKKTARNVALALAFEWFFCKFTNGEKQSVKSAKESATNAVMDMWEKRHWSGATDSYALNKNIRQGRKELIGLYMVIHLHPEENKGFVVVGRQEDFDIQPYQHIEFNGKAWAWHFGKQEARYGTISIPKQALLY